MACKPSGTQIQAGKPWLARCPTLIQAGKPSGTQSWILGVQHGSTLPVANHPLPLYADDGTSEWEFSGYFSKQSEAQKYAVDLRQRVSAAFKDRFASLGFVNIPQRCLPTFLIMLSKPDLPHPSYGDTIHVPPMDNKGTRMFFDTDRAVYISKEQKDIRDRGASLRAALPALPASSSASAKKQRTSNEPPMQIESSSESSSSGSSSGSCGVISEAVTDP